MKLKATMAVLALLVLIVALPAMAVVPGNCNEQNGWDQGVASGPWGTITASGNEVTVNLNAGWSIELCVKGGNDHEVFVVSNPGVNGPYLPPANCGQGTNQCGLSHWAIKNVTSSTTSSTSSTTSSTSSTTSSTSTTTTTTTAGQTTTTVGQVTASTATTEAPPTTQISPTTAIGSTTTMPAGGSSQEVELPLTGFDPIWALGLIVVLVSSGLGLLRISQRVASEQSNT